jgi:hypothetical protein
VAFFPPISRIFYSFKIFFFIVPSKLYNSLREAKKHKKQWRKYLDEDDSYHDIREYARKKKKGPIIVEDERTGACMYVRYGDLR